MTRENESAFSVQWIDDSTLETVFTGRLTKELAVAHRERIQKEISTRAPRFFLINGERLSGFDAAIRSDSAELLRALRAAGVLKVAAVTELSAVRMLGTAVSFAAGLPLKFYAKRAEALAALKSDA